MIALMLAVLVQGSGMPDVRAADARLNAQYRATLAAMRRRDAAAATLAAMRRRDAAAQRGLPGPGYAQALLDAQRKWIAFRDANCLSVGYEYRGGSAERLSRATCIADMTTARTAELRRIQRGASPD